jgi:tetratricopeptide (TPR) repeat protein
MAYLELGEGGLLEPDIAYPKARQAVTAALALDPDQADALCMLGHLKTAADFDWTGAEQAFKRALALQPGHADANAAYGRLLSALRRFDESLALLRRAQQLDPLAHRADVSSALLRAGRYEEALASASQLAEFDPRYDRGQATLGWACLKVGRIEEGLAALERAVALSPESNQWLAQWGQALGQSGQADGAHEVLAQLEARSREGYVSPYHLAYVFTGLGESDRAIDLLEQACAERAGAIYGIAGSFLFEPLRANPRFRALLGRMHLA